MKTVVFPSLAPALSDADYLDLANQTLAQRAPAALEKILANASDHPDLWASEDGQVFLVDILSLVIGALAEGQTLLAFETIKACPPMLAEKSHSLLLLAFFPDGNVSDLSALDDAAMLCMTLLTHRMNHRGRAVELLGLAMERDLAPAMVATANAIGDYFAATARARFKGKLIIWSLDDVLWQGRLSDNHPHDQQRAEIIRTLNAHGIVSAICTGNDAHAARARLEQAGLWDQFVFPHMDVRSKGRVVAQIISDMLLQPANVLFIDNDAGRLAEVAATVPGIRTMDAASDACNALLRTLIEQNSHVNDNRIADYRILEARVADRQSLSDADFLLQSGIQATYTHRMDNLVFVDRIEELINRADPLNYCGTRVVPGTLRDVIMNVSDYDVFSAFIWDKYGHHGLDGLVGVVVYHRPSRKPVHLAFSCRIMHMGVEDFLMKALTERYGGIDLSGLAKPLPAQTSAAITYVPFEDVREQILASQAPRDWSKIRMRLMSDCMSGGFHHYSRFKEEMDFDNIPRVFALAGMLDGTAAQQSFPEFLVYNVAIDYMDWRWQSVMPEIDPARYVQAVEAFSDMVVGNGHKALLLLSPEHAADQYYACLPNLSAQELKARNRAFNQLWRETAARHPERFDLVELNDFVTEADMLTHAYHYAPSTLKHMTEIIDDWYANGGQFRN